MIPASDDRELAEVIDQKGWRQGSVLSPTDHIKISDWQLSPEERLIICTQSCSVVSDRFGTDPLVEVMAIQLLSKFQPKSNETIGRNQRKLQLPCETGSSKPALECDINRRHFFDRKLLASMSPDSDISVGEQGAKTLAGWIGRYYTRIALPNHLVIRMKREALDLMKSILDQKEEGHKVHSSVPHIYLTWEPKEDAADVQLYHLDFLILCESSDIARHLDQKLLAALSEYNEPEGKEGLKINFQCQADTETLLSDLNPYERFSEWDYFSGMDALVSLPETLSSFDSKTASNIESIEPGWNFLTWLKRIVKR